MNSFISGAMVGSMAHFLALELMKKSATHRFLNIFKVSFVTGLGTCVFCASKNYFTKNALEETAKTSIQKELSGMDKLITIDEEKVRKKFEILGGYKD